MSKSLMTLESVQVNYIEIKARTIPGFPIYDKDAPPAAPDGDEVHDIEVRFHVLEHKDAPEFLVPLKITVIPPEPEAFEKITIELSGVFSFPEGTDSTVVSKYVPLLCLTNLFGIARGIIIQSTGAFANRQYILPLVNMQEIVRNQVAEMLLKRVEEKTASKTANTKKKKAVVAKKKISNNL